MREPAKPMRAARADDAESADSAALPSSTALPSPTSSPAAERGTPVPDMEPAPAPTGTAALSAREGAQLARRAAAAVANRLADRPADGRPPAAVGLRVLGATFVTLEENGALLGCVGSLDPARPLYLDAMRNAVRAAADPRLPPVTAAHWPQVDVTVSVLSRPEPLEVVGPRDLIGRLRVGVDGLVLSDGQRRTTFLPSVWRKIDDPEQFLAALLQKGGWAARGQRRRSRVSPRDWPPELVALRYTTAEFTDPAPRPKP